MNESLVKYTTHEDGKILAMIAKLEPKKADIFHLFINGQNQKDIARSLGIPYRDVVYTMTTIRRKFGVDDAYKVLAASLPAMIRKECQDEANAIAIPAKPVLVAAAGKGPRVAR
jgi:FixJ family two-component response regulator